MATKTTLNKAYSKIASIIGSCLKGFYTQPWHGAYYHATNGKLVATDGRRLVVFHNEKKIAKSRYRTEDGTLLSKPYPNYEKLLNEKVEIVGEWTIDLGKLIKEKGWMDLKKDGIQNVVFKSKFIHYKKGTKRVAKAKEEDVILNVIDGKYIADVLRCYRAYNHNRTDTMEVKIVFTRYGDKGISPCRIETLDSSMTHLIMPRLTLEENGTVIELENKKIF